MGQKKAVSKDKDDSWGGREANFFLGCSEIGRGGSKLKYK